MSLLCKLFGHKPQEGVYSGAEYMRVQPGAIDGIGREHARLYARCARCEKEYAAGSIHLPERESEKQLRKVVIDRAPAAQWNRFIEAYQRVHSMKEMPLKNIMCGVDKARKIFLGANQ